MRKAAEAASLEKKLDHVRLSIRDATTSGGEPIEISDGAGYT
jgi:hypothetical protein